MSILAPMMTLQEQQSEVLQDSNSSLNWIEWSGDDDISAITDPNHAPPLTSCLIKRQIQPCKSSFLTKRCKTDPLTPKTMRRVKFLATADQDREYRWSAMA